MTRALQGRRALAGLREAYEAAGGDLLPLQRLQVLKAMTSWTTSSTRPVLARRTGREVSASAPVASDVLSLSVPLGSPGAAPAAAGWRSWLPGV